MKNAPRSRMALVVGSFVVAISGVLLPETIVAGTEMKRSAGKVSRSLGSRQGSSLGANRRGYDSSTSTAQQSRTPGSRSPEEEDELTAEFGADEKTEEQAVAESTTSDSEDSTDEIDEEEAEIDYESRTLGRACIYGTRGEVVFRPRGGRCRGDEMTRRPDIRQKRDRSPAKPRGTRGGPAALRPRTPHRDTGKPAASKNRPRGRCIYGAADRVIYSPPGVDCRR